MVNIAVIPARSGSKGIPSKNVKPLASKPLIAYSIAAAKKSKLINRIIVSTDSEKYANLAREYGADVPFLRPAELAGDTSTDYDFIKHLLDWLEINEGGTPDYLIHLRPTTPLRDPEIIDHAIDLYLSMPDYDFVGNDLKTTYPPGMEVEVFSIKALLESAKRCMNSVIREHGTLFLRTNPDIFCLYNFEAGKSLGRTDLAFEVDTIEDFRVIKKILEHFQGRVGFSLREIIKFVDAAGDLAEGNRHVTRRWKQYRNN